LRAQELTAFQEKERSGCGDFTRVEAKGQVFYVTPAETIRADAAVYEPTKDLATFTGNVVAVRGKDVTATDRLVVNISTGEAQADGRFRAVIYPKPKTGQAK
jgi:lipopolysaccharide export system protein LptA